MPATMPQLQRPLTLSFPTKGFGRVTEGNVIKALTDSLHSTDIKAVQVTESDCRVTTRSIDAKQRLSLARVNI